MSRTYGTVSEITKDDIERCIQVLRELTGNPVLVEQFENDQLNALLEAAGRFSRPNKIEIQKRHKAFYNARKKEKQRQDRSTRASTGIREARVAPSDFSGIFVVRVLRLVDKQVDAVQHAQGDE